MKYLILLACMLGLTFIPSAKAQNKSIEVYGVGNFNPTTRVYIDPTYKQQMISSNRSAIGGAVEGDYWFKPNLAVGVEYEQNPSNGKLVFQPVPPIGLSIWPQMRHEVLALFTQEAPLSRTWSIFLKEGAGVNITNGFGNSGISHDTAFVEGAGVDKNVSKHVAVEVGALWLQTETGCYNGQRCKQTWGTVTDTHVGLKFRF